MLESKMELRGDVLLIHGGDLGWLSGIIKSSGEVYVSTPHSQGDRDIPGISRSTAQRQIHLSQ